MSRWHETLEGLSLVNPSSGYPQAVNVRTSVLTSVGDSRLEQLVRELRALLSGELKDLESWLNLLSTDQIDHEARLTRRHPNLL
jgi:hypothetical protein